MKRLILLTITSIMLCNLSFSQITTIKIADKREEISKQPYDSLENFLGTEVYKYVGQELYVNGKMEGLRKYGYEGFTIDYTKSRFDNGIYKCCDGHNSKYEELAGKYFNVINVHKHPKVEKSSVYKNIYFLELIEQQSGDTVYFEYWNQFEHKFPFITVAYFIKQKDINLGKEFVVRGKNWIHRTEPMLDINTGKPVTFIAGGKWKCVDFTIEERYYDLALILENDKGEKIPLSFDRLNSTHFVFDAKDAEMYKQKFGQEIWEKILIGRVNIGFTEEMVRLSWGNPEKINRASYGDQWVYDERYLYFENGILKAFN